jgi:predicted transcriptional regulator
MPTTTIRLTEELKERVSRAAEQAGATSHAFILDAIAQRVDEEERRNEFFAEAEQRYAKIVASGLAVSWDEMRRYLQERGGGGNPSRPSARKIGG